MYSTCTRTSQQQQHLPQRPSVVPAHGMDWLLGMHVSKRSLPGPAPSSAKCLDCLFHANEACETVQRLSISDSLRPDSIAEATASASNHPNKSGVRSSVGTSTRTNSYLYCTLPAARACSQCLVPTPSSTVHCTCTCTYTQKIQPRRLL